MRQIININKDWFFLKNSKDINSTDEFEQINLPHTWNNIDGTDGGNDYFRGSSVYKKRFAMDELPTSDEYFLEIKGANSSAKVYLNDIFIMEHDGGYSTFRVELTKYLQEKNTLVIIVDNSINDFVYPQVADFTFYGGIYRDVNIICVNHTHFDLEYYGGNGLLITPTVNGTNALVNVAVFIKNKEETDDIVYKIFDKKGLILEEKTNCLSPSFSFGNVHLWNGISDPYLYSLKVTIVRNGMDIDEISSSFGCRSFSIDPQKGFILNGKEYPLRGVSRHQDRAGFGNAILKAHHNEDMELICEVGANSIRLAHYQHDQYFYDLCDEKGMIVWAEIPYISKHMQNGNDNTISQMKELIIQNYNHPSIVLWGLSNEITMENAKDLDMVKNHIALNDLVHKLDKTRYTTIACLSMCPVDSEYVHIPDVIAYNHYFGWYGGDVFEYGPWFDKFHEKYPNVAIGCSEYGCEALNWHNSNPQAGDYSEEYQAYYHENVIKQLFNRKWIWSTYVWNMFDFGADARAEGGENGQNHKGLVTFDRKYKKDSFYAYKAWLSKEPFVHICSKRYIDRVEDVTKVTVYSNLDEVELFLNGVSQGRKKSNDHFFYFMVSNVGKSHLEAIAGECRDESYINKVDKMNEDYILRESNAVLNWFDIKKIEGRFSLNDKLGDILKTVRGKIWFGMLLLKIKQKQKKDQQSSGIDISSNKNMIKMLSGMSILRLTGMMSMKNISFTKEELLKMNNSLNKIKKPKKLDQ